VERLRRDLDELDTTHAGISDVGENHAVSLLLVSLTVSPRLLNAATASAVRPTTSP
jgi:hypothetical protein